MAVAVNTDKQERREASWALIFASVIAIAAGTLVISYPDRTLIVLAIAIGVALIISGTVQLVTAFRRRHVTGAVHHPVLGIVALIAGLIVIRHPGDSLLALAIAVGVYLIISGLLRLGAAASVPGARWLLILLGLIDLGAGVLIVAWPEFGLAAFAIVVGITFIVRGFGGIALAILIRKEKEPDLVAVV